MNIGCFRPLVGLWAFLLLLPATIAAQGAGSITGVVRDTSGAVLPGVTVEATSPALIEKVRAAVTDGQGVYRIVDLRPGTYAVTFSLTGFGSVRREGVELTTGFTATINADLSVGTLEETITVSGAAPLVDTQNATQQRVFSREVLQSVPIAASVREYATLIPGAVVTAAAQDVGGSKGEANNWITIHGGRTGDFQHLRDGMYFGTLAAAGNWMSRTNPATVGETAVQTSGMGAEYEGGGVTINVIQRDGGNVFSGTFNGSFSRPGLQSSNLSDELRARGLTQGGPEIKTRYSSGGGIGGPLLRDRLWFFGSARTERISSYWPGQFWDATPETLFYTPDFSRRAYDLFYFNDLRGRMTWQASAKDKVSVTAGNEWNCDCASNAGSGTRAPEAYGQWGTDPNFSGQVIWTRPHTNRLLLEAGATYINGALVSFPFGAGGHEGGSIDDRFVLDQSRNFGYGGVGTLSFGGYGRFNYRNTSQRFTASYVTGSHAAKMGVSYLWGENTSQYDFPPSLSAMTYVFNGRSPGATPTAVTLYAAPHYTAVAQQKFAFFAQDQWTIDRLTLNVGVRFDQLNGSAPALDVPAGPWVPARSFPEVTGIPSWKDWQPRFGAAYNLFGDGRTAIKASLGRYVHVETLLPGGGFGSVTSGNAPAGRLVTSTTRTWNDANGDYVPQESELGPLANRNFGTTVVTNTYSPDVLDGSRGYNWQGALQLEQELGGGVAVSVGYFRTWYGNFRVIHNRAVTAQDFTSYCITGPTHSALPGGGGQQICGLYDVVPAKFGQTDLFVDLASKYGDPSEVFNGVDLSVRARFLGAGYVQGGVSTGSTTTDQCYANDRPELLPDGFNSANPRTSEFCNVSTPWWAGNTQFKGAVVLPLWWNFRASANYQNIPSIETGANALLSNATVAPALGRDLAACGARTGAACAATALINVVPPGTNYLEPRLQQLDLRFSRLFRLPRGGTIEPMIDIFNALNSSAVRGIQTRVGPAYNFPFGIIDPRLVKIGVNINY